MGGSGGSSAGEISYPTYMETRHEAWLASINTDISVAKAADPYVTATAYDPDTVLAASTTAVSTFASTLSTYSNPLTYWQTVFAGVETTIEDYVDDIVDAFNDELDDDMTNTILPEFKGSMRTLGAVNTSAFSVGEAVLLAMKARDKATYEAKMRMTQNELVLKAVGQVEEQATQVRNLAQALASLTIESNRIKIVALKEEITEQLEFDSKSALWDLETWRYGANMLASISGGATSVGQNTPSKAQTALGGAMSGAAIGAQLGGAHGAVIGGFIGGIGGLIAGS